MILNHKAKKVKDQMRKSQVNAFKIKKSGVDKMYNLNFKMSENEANNLNIKCRAIYDNIKSIR